MRCKACDCVLTDFEATRKSKESGQYVDLCNHCFDSIKGSFPVVEREDLKTWEDSGWDEDYDDEND